MLGVPQKMYDELFSKYSALVDEVVQMKRDGYVAQPRFDTEPEPDQFPVPEEVLGALHMRFDPGSFEAKEQQEHAFGMLRRGLDKETVIAAVLAGEDIGM